MANLLEGIGQAYAQDYRNVRKREKDAERKARRDQLLYSTILAPLGQSLAQGVTEFINQPYVSKHQDFVGRESRRYRKQYGDHIGLKERLDELDSQASAAHVHLYNRSNSDTELTREVVREFGPNWEVNQAARAYYDESKSKSLAAYKQQVDELRKEVAKGASLEMTPDEYRARLEKTSPYAKTAVGAGFRAIGRMIGIGNTKPLDEREMEALKSANPTVHAYISGRSRAEFQRDYNAARDLTASAERPEFTEDQKSLRATVARQRENALDYNRILTNGKLGNTNYDQRFAAWADKNNLLTNRNASSFVPGNENYERALIAFNNNEAYTSWVKDQSVVFGAQSKNEDVQGRIEAIKAAVPVNALTNTNFISMKKQIEEFIEDGTTSTALNGYFMKQVEKVTESVITENNFRVAAASTQIEVALGLIRDKYVVGERLDPDRKAEDAKAAKNYQTKVLKDITAATAIEVRRQAENSWREGNSPLTKNQLLASVPPIMQQVANTYLEKGDLSEFLIDQDVLNAAVAQEETDPSIDPPKVLTDESISQAVKEGQAKSVALSHVETLNTGGETTNPKIPLMTSKDSSLVYDSGTFRFTVAKRTAKAALDWDNIENVLGMFSDEDAAIIKTDMQSRQLVIKDLEEKLGMSYPEAIKITRMPSKSRNLFIPPENQNQEKSSAQKMNDNLVFRQLYKELSRLDLPGLDTDVVSPFGDRDLFIHNKTYEFIMGEEFSIEEESPSIEEESPSVVSGTLFDPELRRPFKKDEVSSTPSSRSVVSGTLFDPELRRPLERDKALPADIDPDDYSFGPVAEQQITIRSPELGLLPGEQGPANSFVETGDDIIREVVNLIPIKKPLNKNVVDEEQQKNLFTFLDQIATVESNKGQDRGTYDIYSGDTGRGSLGVFQMDEVAFDEIKHRAVGDKTSFKKFKKHLGVINGFLEDTIGKNMNTIEFEDIADDRVNALFARLYLLTKPDKIPSTNLGRARLWKKVYNTEKGRGTDIRYLIAIGDMEPASDTWLKEQMDRIESQKSLLSRTPESFGSLDSESAMQQIF